MEYEIKRENSKYNKSMKWHLIGKGLNGSIFSTWYKTRKDAEYGLHYYKDIVTNKYATCS